MKVLGCLIGAVIASYRMAQDLFPDIPDNHSLYRFEAHMKAIGWFHTDEPFHTSGSPRRRSVFAQLTVDFVNALPRHIEDDTAELKIFIAQGKSSLYPDNLIQFRSYVREVTLGTKRWIDEFSGELLKLGSSKEILLRKLSDSRPGIDRLVRLYDQAIQRRERFSDVPDRHWAAKSVQKLKEVGILVGYPDGKFHG